MSAQPGQRFSALPWHASIDEELTDSEYRTLGVIAAFSDRDGWSFPSQGKLAEIRGLSRKTINEHIKTLREREYLRVEPRTREDGGQTSNRMRVVLDRTLQGVSRLDVTGGVTSRGYTNNYNNINYNNVYFREKEEEEDAHALPLFPEEQSSSSLPGKNMNHVKHDDARAGAERSAESKGSGEHSSSGWVQAYGEFLEMWADLFPEKIQPRPSTKKYQNKFRTRYQTPGFREKWREALVAASESPALHQEGWFQVTFFLHNDENWQKCLQRWMSWKDREIKAKEGAKLKDAADTNRPPLPGPEPSGPPIPPPE